MSWPAHALCEEDWHFRRNKWDSEGYANMRTLLTDDTGLPLAYQPSDAGLQSAMYSLYYGLCCLKGAVTAQFCGFIRTLPLFAGATSDSEYDKKNGSAQMQRELYLQLKDNADTAVRYERSAIGAHHVLPPLPGMSIAPTTTAALESNRKSLSSTPDRACDGTLMCLSNPIQGLEDGLTRARFWR